MNKKLLFIICGIPIAIVVLAMVLPLLIFII